MAKALKTAKTVAALAAKAGASVPSVAASKPAKAAATAPAVVAAERTTLPPTARITVVATANPKRPGTKAASKWPLYAEASKAAKGVLTVAAVVSAFVAKGYPKRRAYSAMRWDNAHGFIKIDTAAKA